jgi:glycosyltransferase involved in cell wall biosynthesis
MTAGARLADLHPFSFLFRDRLFPFYPPIDSNLFVFTEQKRKNARKYLGVPENCILVGTVGNQNKQKSHEQFVEIARRINQKMPFVFFRIIGSRSESHRRYYIRQVIRRQERYFSSEIFRIVESTITIDQIMCAFDIFLLTSGREGLPTVILEAMSVGLPIVTSNVGSIPEIIINGINGYRFEYGDVADACSKIIRLANSPEERGKISIQNRSEAEGKYDLSHSATVHSRAYQNALNANSIKAGH